MAIQLSRGPAAEPAVKQEILMRLPVAAGVAGL
jgi:hypothetical protein